MSTSARHLQVRLRSYVVIPARLKSSRLPRKLLLNETGKPLIQHTYEAAAQAKRPLGLCVAVDDPELADAVRQFGGDARITRPDAHSGTDRVAELAGTMHDTDVVVNVQGDEPDVAADDIDLVIRLLEEDPTVEMATLATPIRDRARLLDPACVKVVIDAEGYAHYFSRAPIPYPRDGSDDLLDADPPHFLQHVGLYAYRRNFLLRLAAMPPGRWEQLESLEQLRVLESGQRIRVGVTQTHYRGIDTASDYRAFVSRTRNC